MVPYGSVTEQFVPGVIPGRQIAYAIEALVFVFWIFFSLFWEGSRLTWSWVGEATAYLLGDEDLVDGAYAGDGDALLLAEHRRGYEDHSQRQVAPTWKRNEKIRICVNEVLL